MKSLYHALIAWSMLMRENDLTSLWDDFRRDARKFQRAFLAPFRCSFRWL